MSNTDGDQAVGPDDCVEKEDPEAHDSFDFRDELAEAFGEPRPTFVGGQYTQATESLPQQVDDGDVADAHAPPFTASNQCCHADRSAFVVRDERGRVVRTFAPSDVKRDPDGRFRAEVEAWQASNDAHSPRLVRLTLVVEPKRIECRHLVRQLKPLTPTERLTGHYSYGWMHRYCAARRSTAGAFLDLTDQEMAACSLREPYDEASASRLDAFDDKLQHRSENREYTEMFKLSKQFMAPMERRKEGTP